MSNAWLALRSIMWAVLLPGVMAFYLPWRFFGLNHWHTARDNPLHVVGAALAVTGTVLLVICILEFARSGRGTLSPADPPKELVVQGLYRYVRNPMYVSVSIILIGEYLLTASLPILYYWIVWFAVVNLFVIGYEEPALRRQFGESYDRYAREVGRWIPNFGRRVTGDG